MTDTELIKAVAEKVGWTDYVVPDWLTSVDAALGAIKPSNEFELWKDCSGWNCSDHGSFSHGETTECRAILEAFVKLPKEKL